MDSASLIGEAESDGKAKLVYSRFDCRLAVLAEMVQLGSNGFIGGLQLNHVYNHAMMNGDKWGGSGLMILHFGIRE